MKKTNPNLKMKDTNPISDLIDDKTHKLLSQYDILDKRAIRDYNIWKEYHSTTKDLSRQERAMMLSLKHNLKYETILKIIYQNYGE